ncbi:MAG: T9SS type A sorting domain-containing protein [Bacteroidota bacterium]|nr:T9SS type A sorting domain-containing protein [Bacteroidota bacterium]
MTILTIFFTSSATTVVSITSPVNGAKYKAGDFVTCTGFAIDSNDGTLTGSSLTWVVDFYHDAHVHDAVKLGTGNKFVFDVPLAGELSATVHFRIKLKAENSLGDITEEHIDVWPYLANFTVTSTPAGATAGIGLLGNLQTTLPITFASTQALNWNIITKAVQTVSGEVLYFSHFNDTNYRNLSIGFAMPAIDTLFHAYFVKKQTLDAFGISDSVSIQANRDSIISFSMPSELIWKIHQLPNWITAVRKNGAFGESIIFKFKSVDFTDNRLAVITITGGGYTQANKLLKIYQYKNTKLNVSKNELLFNNTSINQTVTITGAEAWTAEASDSWIILSTTQGVGDIQLTITIDNNNWSNNQSGTVTIKSASSTKYIIVRHSGTTGLDENQGNQIQISPNPFITKFRVLFNQKVNNITLATPFGDHLSHFNVENMNSIDIDSGQLPIGMYFLIIRTNNEIITKKIIKN